MLNSLRYGFATFLSFSKPITFLVLALITTYIVVAATQIIATVVIGLMPDAEVQTLGVFGARVNVMNAMVMFFLSVPVAGQFAQEFRFNTLASTFLVAPNRYTLFISKAAFALTYVFASIGIIWASFNFTASIFPPALSGKGIFGPLYSANFELGWKLEESSDWWKVLVYVAGYMVIVIAMATITRSQTLGVLIPVFYLLFVEHGIGLAFGLYRLESSELFNIFDPLRFFMQGQAWVNADAAYPYAGLIYFGGVMAMFMWSFILFVRRDAKFR